MGDARSGLEARRRNELQTRELATGHYGHLRLRGLRHGESLCSEEGLDGLAKRGEGGRLNCLQESLELYV